MTGRFMTRGNELPSYNEHLISLVVCEHYRENKYKDLPDELIHDLWNIVFWYLDYIQPMELSLPIKAFAQCYTIVGPRQGDFGYFVPKSIKPLSDTRLRPGRWPDVWNRYVDSDVSRCRILAHFYGQFLFRRFTTHYRSRSTLHCAFPVFPRKAA